MKKQELHARIEDIGSGLAVLAATVGTIQDNLNHAAKLSHTDNEAALFDIRSELAGQHRQLSGLAGQLAETGTVLDRRLNKHDEKIAIESERLSAMIAQLKEDAAILTDEVGRLRKQQSTREVNGAASDWNTVQALQLAHRELKEKLAGHSEDIQSLEKQLDAASERTDNAWKELTTLLGTTAKQKTTSEAIAGLQASLNNLKTDYHHRTLDQNKTATDRDKAISTLAEQVESIRLGMVAINKMADPGHRQELQREIRKYVNDEIKKLKETLSGHDARISQTNDLLSDRLRRQADELQQFRETLHESNHERTTQATEAIKISNVSKYNIRQLELLNEAVVGLSDRLQKHDQRITELQGCAITTVKDIRNLFTGNSAVKTSLPLQRAELAPGIKRARARQTAAKKSQPKSSAGSKPTIPVEGWTPQDAKTAKKKKTSKPRKS